MKKVLLTVFLSMTILCGFTSCSSTALNDAKVSVAKKAKIALEKELVKAFDKYEIEGECEVEAKMHGEYFYDKFTDLLKVKKEEQEKIQTQKSSSFSLMNLVSSSSEESEGSLAQKACYFVLEKGLPLIVEKSGEKAKCLKALGTIKMIEVGKKACQKIKI